MKKVLALVLFAVLAFAFVGCDTTTTEAPKEWKVAMITDVGTITDKSFNQGTWEGVAAFCTANEIPHMYFRPNAGTTADYVAAIDMVVEAGYNVIVTPGFLFEESIWIQQEEYPEVTFILIDGTPHDANYTDFTQQDNVLSILFQEEQSGFLAGYAAVADGYEDLGFLGGMAVPAVRRFGIGFIAGAYYAAEELSKTINFPASAYQYLGNFNNNADNQLVAAGFYSSGVDIIFAAAGGAGNSVMAAAEALDPDGVMIGVDVDQSNQSTTVISSAMKQLAVAVNQALTDLIIDDDFEGGIVLTKGAAQDAVGLPLGDSFKWETFTEAQYTTLLNLIKAGTIDVPTTEAELAAFLAAECGDPSAAALVAGTEVE
jgi:basic membrane protein A